MTDVQLKIALKSTDSSSPRERSLVGEMRDRQLSAIDKKAEAMVRSADPSVPFARMASTGSHRGPHSRSLRVRYRLRPLVGRRRAFPLRLRFRRQPCGHVQAISSCVTSSMETVYWWTAGFSWLSLVTWMSPEALTSKANWSACARFCAVSSASRASTAVESATVAFSSTTNNIGTNR